MMIKRLRVCTAVSIFIIFAIIYMVIKHERMTSPMNILTRSIGGNTLFPEYNQSPEDAGDESNWMYQPPEINTRLVPYFPYNKYKYMGKQVPVNYNTCFKGKNPWMPPQYPPTYALLQD